MAKAKKKVKKVRRHLPKPFPDAINPRGRYEPEKGGRSGGRKSRPLSTTAMPGTEEKVRIMARRHRQGQDLHARGDVKITPENYLQWKSLRNGAIVPEKVSGEKKASCISADSRILGDRIRYFRERAKLTRKQLALRSGVTPDCLYKLERDERIPRLDVAVAIAEGLRITLDKLVGRTTPAPE